MKPVFETTGTCLNIKLPEELDHPASDEIRRDSDRIIGHNYIKNMIFDFSETVFMDSSGIGVIIGRCKSMGFSGGEVAATNMNERVKKIFMVSGLQKLIRVDTV